MAYSVAIDAGHGGSDFGAMYGNRSEKDDVFRLANAVGSILQKNGVNVFYVRNDDEYETPFKKATDANNAGVDYFVSIHRNSSPTPNTYSGVQTLVYSDDGVRAQLARNINEELVKLGFKDLGVDERPNLVVLKRTKMPAVLVEAGFINNDEDNRIFDENFDAVAQGIADGILKTLYSEQGSMETSNAGNDGGMPWNRAWMNDDDRDENNNRQNNSGNMPNNTGMDRDQAWMNRNMPMNGNMPMNNNMGNDGGRPERLYRVQVGAYRNKESADRMLNSLLSEGYPAFVIYEDGLYKVQVGAFEMLANAIRMEERLRRSRYNTYITT